MWYGKHLGVFCLYKCDVGSLVICGWGQSSSGRLPLNVWMNVVSSCLKRQQSGETTQEGRTFHVGQSYFNSLYCTYSFQSPIYWKFGSIVGLFSLAEGHSHLDQFPCSSNALFNCSRIPLQNIFQGIQKAIRERMNKCEYNLIFF